MDALATESSDLRAEAARLAVALIRFEGVAAHPFPASTPPGALHAGTEAWTFIPSWTRVPADAVEAFLVSLPSPALLSQTTTRGVIALLLLHELSGDRRRWAEKTFSNYDVGLDAAAGQLGLTPESPILVEFDDESHLFSLAAVRAWSQAFAVQVGWNLRPLHDDPHADACMGLMRSDGRWYEGRSCIRGGPDPGR
jgi:hypothetical protein